MFLVAVANVLFLPRIEIREESFFSTYLASGFAYNNKHHALPLNPIAKYENS